MHDREGAEQMEMIYNWILKLSFFAVLGSVILQMIPDHGFQKYVRFVLGLILAAMLVVPVLFITSITTEPTEFDDPRRTSKSIQCLRPATPPLTVAAALPCEVVIVISAASNIPP